MLAIAAGGVVLGVIMAVAWGFALLTRNGGWADTFWTFGIGAGGIVAAVAQPGGAFERQILVVGLVALWSLRLGTYLVGRTYGREEDARYAALRQQWGGSHSRRLFLFLEAQALAGLPLIGAIALAAGRPGVGLDLLDAAGAIVLVAGIAGGGLADRQLARFKADPGNRGRVCDAGLWSLSRHPNYFFEWLAWCAWPVIAFDPLGYPQGLLALAAPALMYYLLVYVSGIPLLEAHMERSRGEAFAAYKARTPAFFPSLSNLLRRGASPGVVS